MSGTPGDNEVRPRQDGAVAPVDGARPIRVYFMPRTRSERVLWTLDEAGLPYVLHHVRGPERRSPEHLLRHPLGRVPAIELPNGTTVFESAAICLAVADLAPAAELIAPLGSASRALDYQWALFAMTELEGPLFRWIRAQREGTGDAASSERFLDAARALHAALGDRAWLVDGRFGVGDVLCASVLSSAHSRGLLAGLPSLEGYVTRAQARPAYQRALSRSAEGAT